MAKRKKKKVKKSSSNKWILAFVLVIGVCSFFYFWYKSSNSEIHTQAEFLEQFPEGFKSIGIDISHHQGEIDWEDLLVKKHYDTLIDFIYCKVTEGSDHLDTQWEKNRIALNEHGMMNGAYHYFNPKSPPRPQAKFFLSNYLYRSIDLPPVLDVEDEGFSDSDLIAKIRIWGDEVYKKIGVRPIIYTSLSFYETKFRGKLPEYSFWLAAYSRKPIYMDDPQVIHWQFSETGRIPTILNTIDLNVSKNSFD